MKKTTTLRLSDAERLALVMAIRDWLGNEYNARRYGTADEDTISLLERILAKLGASY